MIFRLDGGALRDPPRREVQDQRSRQRRSVPSHAVGTIRRTVASRAASSQGVPDEGRQDLQPLLANPHDA